MERSLETIDDKKNRIAEKLSTAYSLNLISMEEYERLIEYGQKIETERELRVLEKIAEETSLTKEDYNNETAPYASAANHMTVLSSRKITGAITNGNIFNILGDTRIYLTEKDLINRETALNIFAVLGNVKIFVPDNVEVICHVLPILGEISVRENKRNNASGKRLIINGNVVLGEVKIKGK